MDAPAAMCCKSLLPTAHSTHSAPPCPAPPLLYQDEEVEWLDEDEVDFDDDEDLEDLDDYYAGSQEGKKKVKSCPVGWLGWGWVGGESPLPPGWLLYRRC